MIINRAESDDEVDVLLELIVEERILPWQLFISCSFQEQQFSICLWKASTKTVFFLYFVTFVRVQEWLSSEYKKMYLRDITSITGTTVLIAATDVYINRLIIKATSARM